MEPDFGEIPLPIDWERRKAERVRKNEAAFKQYNERRKAFEEQLAEPDDLIPFVCECGDAGCYDGLPLTIDEFDQAHARRMWYAVKPRHVMPDYERVVQQHDSYWIVEKYDPGEAPAERAAMGSSDLASP
jgi:hypothetical protein